ncbi:MAG: hypothetical protein K5644_09925 [Lachnospiraceae bacterium]|nr:hypothetical protein [Lachnospiraceae bacterium]
MYAFIFLMIFGVIILFVALSIGLSKDPRNYMFMIKVHGNKKPPLDEARAEAKKVAKVMAIVGAVITVLCLIGFVIMYFFFQ